MPDENVFLSGETAAGDSNADRDDLVVGVEPARIYWRMPADSH